MELGRQIKQHRKGRGLSQEDLAAAIYVSRQTVSNWETDRTYPDVENLLLLSNLFGTTIDELVKGDVETMKGIIADDKRKMGMLSIAGGVCAVLATVATIGGISFWDWGIVPSAIIGFLLMAACIVAMAMIGSIRKKHDLVTYREVVAFSKGETVDRDNLKSLSARQQRFTKAVARRLIAAIIGGLLGCFAYKLIG